MSFSKSRRDVLAVLVTSTDSACQIGSRGSVRSRSLGRKKKFKKNFRKFKLSYLSESVKLRTFQLLNLFSKFFWGKNSLQEDRTELQHARLLLSSLRSPVSRLPLAPPGQGATSQKSRPELPQKNLFFIVTLSSIFNWILNYYYISSGCLSLRPCAVLITLSHVPKLSEDSGPL